MPAHCVSFPPVGWSACASNRASFKQLVHHDLHRLRVNTNPHAGYSQLEAHSHWICPRMTPAGSATLCAFTHACPACKEATEAGWQRWCLRVLLVFWGMAVCPSQRPTRTAPLRG